MTEKPAPLVSVIMNCLNCERYLKEALDSAYAQTYPHWEIIFWDNASTDGSAEIARSYDDRLRYFRGEETIPLGRARNMALTKARGELIAFLDCDDIWLPEKLQKQVPLFDDPEVGLVYCDTIFFNEEGDIRRLYETRPFYRGRCLSELLTDYFLSMESTVIRAEVLKDMKEWFDPEFEMIEEADFFRRLALNWKLDLVREPLSKWRVHSQSWSWKKTHLFKVESERMIEKYRAEIPGFSEDYRSEIETLRRALEIEEAKSLLSRAEGGAARKILKRHLFKDKRAPVLMVLTFFPALFQKYQLRPK